MKYYQIGIYLKKSAFITNEHKTERLHAIIKTRQNGLCYFCRTEFEGNDVMVSHGYLNRHYYHKVCAEKLHII
jgi:hypothetical protein